MRNGGLNTVLDAIAAQTPMLALPIAFDQPGAAARMRHAGAGLVASPRLAGAGHLARQLRQLLDDATFVERLAPLAADIVEAALGLASVEAA
jgi:zeaxanthin glucosyltransferase